MSQVRVGVSVFVKKDGKILFGKRKGSHGAGQWSFPGGHLELGESFEDCCMREAMEETGLKIKNLQPLTFTNDIFSDTKHYVTLFFSADYDSGELVLMEPDRCEEWGWFDIDEIPSPLFLPIVHIIESCGKSFLFGV